jgi:hypothetical protein
MAVKAVEMVRKIRDRHYEETKDFSIEEQIRFIKEKSIQLQIRISSNDKARVNSGPLSTERN